MTEKAKPSDVPEPPDGGYGWIVVFCLFWAACLSFSIFYSIGILFENLMDEFGCSISQLATIASISYCIQCISAPVVSPLQYFFPIRGLICFGISVCCVSMVSSAYVPNVYALYFTIGFLGGVGMAFIYVPINVILPLYFLKRRSFAFALVLIGGYVGCFIFPFLIRFLVSVYGWRGALTILGAVQLNSLPAALLVIKPQYRAKKPSRQGEMSVESQQIEHEKKKFEVSYFTSFANLYNDVIASTIIASKHALSDSAYVSVSILNNLRRSTITVGEPISEELPADEIVKVEKSYITFFKNLRFAFFSLNTLCLGMVFYFASVFIADYGNTIGLPVEKTTFLMSCIGVGHVIGRPIIAFVSDRYSDHRLHLSMVMIIIIGLITATTTLFPSFYHLTVFVLSFAFFIGGCHTQLVPIMADLVPREQLILAIGVLLGAEGLGYLIGPPLISLFSSYTMRFISGGVIMLVMAVILLVIILMADGKKL